MEGGGSLSGPRVMHVLDADWLGMSADAGSFSTTGGLVLAVVSLVLGGAIYLVAYASKPAAGGAAMAGAGGGVFTGGEPFVNPWFIQILDYALDHRPCFVLTNGTEPLLNRMRQVIKLKDKPNPLAFRISLDHPDPAKHDAMRGRPGAFRGYKRYHRNLAF